MVFKPRHQRPKMFKFLRLYKDPPLLQVDAEQQ